MGIEAIVTDPGLASVLQTSGHARQEALALAELVVQLRATGSDGIGEVQPAAADIVKQGKLLLTNLAHLRGLHRAAVFRARESRAATSESRQEVDRLHLQLQNLYYEQRHLQGDIAACESYDHKYQQLPLIPVEEFLALQPEHADDDENALMIARIAHEKAEREALEQQRQELLKRRAKIVADNKKRRDDLANLDKDLEKFIDAAKPIQTMFEKVV